MNLADELLKEEELQDTLAELSQELFFIRGVKNDC